MFFLIFLCFLHTKHRVKYIFVLEFIYTNGQMNKTQWCCTEAKNRRNYLRNVEN